MTEAWAPPTLSLPHKRGGDHNVPCASVFRAARPRRVDVRICGRTGLPQLKAATADKSQ